MTPRIGCLLNRLLVVCLCWLGSLSSCGLYVSLRTVCLFSLLRLCGPVDCVSGGFGTVCPRGLGICMRSVWLVIQYLADFVSAMLVVAKKKKSCCSELLGPARLAGICSRTPHSLGLAASRLCRKSLLSIAHIIILLCVVFAVMPTEVPQTTAAAAGWHACNQCRLII